MKHFLEYKCCSRNHAQSFIGLKPTLLLGKVRGSGGLGFWDKQSIFGCNFECTQLDARLTENNCWISEQFTCALDSDKETHFVICIKMSLPKWAKWRFRGGQVRCSKWRGTRKSRRPVIKCHSYSCVRCSSESTQKIHQVLKTVVAVSYFPACKRLLGLTMCDYSLAFFSFSLTVPRKYGRYPD